MSSSVYHPVPDDVRERAFAWLVEQGYAIATSPGSIDLTPDGRDWLLMALWVGTGLAGMPDDVYLESVNAD